MKIKRLKFDKFKRFHDLELPDIPPARLIVVAGPNGSGKSSLFDGFAAWSAMQRQGLSWQNDYYNRKDESKTFLESFKIDFHSIPSTHSRIYIRTAFRNEPDFQVGTLTRQSPVLDETRFSRMIDNDAALSKNYQRLASDAVEDVFDRADGNQTISAFRESVIGDLRLSMLRLFPDLTLQNLGNPLSAGTFKFTKGAQTGFPYKNLSGGEKAAFDLILDLVVKRRGYGDTIYAIDEPETHVNPRLHGRLLEELLTTIPPAAQLWVATHSVGMLRMARKIYDKASPNVVFYDFGDKDFDGTIVLHPEKPSRTFWERTLTVALDDLADLVGPREVVICEGNPSGAVAGKNDDHDAKCYAAIFSNAYPDVSFVSGGSSKEVHGDRLRFAAVFPKIVKGISVRRVIDRDGHSPTDVAQFLIAGFQVLRRRHLESYFYDDEVISALYETHGRKADFPAYQAEKKRLLADSLARGNPSDDIKSAAPKIFDYLRKHLNLVDPGNDQTAFVRHALTPLVHRDTSVYKELEEDIFGRNS